MRLIQANGQPRWGQLTEPVDEVNFLDYDRRDTMDRPRGLLARRMGFNQFTFVGVHGASVVGGLAIVDLKLMAKVFCYACDLTTGEMQEASWTLPFGLGVRIDPTPDSGSARMKLPGRSVIVAATETGGRRVSVTAGEVDWALQLRSPQGFDPLRVCSRAGYDGWVYTQKAAGLLLSGSMRWGDRTWSFDGPGDSGSIDWSCGYMRKDTFWNWACLSGWTRTGVRIGLNLAAGVNETGVTENALWLGGRLIKLGLAQFDFDRYNESAPWRLATSDGQVELVFERVGTRRERLNAGVLASNFRQHCGRFRGRVRDAEGVWHELDGVSGFVEDHYARW